VSGALGVVGWLGWALALAAAWALRRRMTRLADAEHELRGAATAIALLAERTPELRLELDRLGAGLAELAAARGARVTASADVEAGRLAQVLGNVAANAAEHGVGPVTVRARRGRGVAWLEVANADRAGPLPRGGGGQRLRGRGLRIAERAARQLGGRLTVERQGGVTRAVVELPAKEAEAPGRRLP
jgi:signal transduction histidine kinase